MIYRASRRLGAMLLLSSCIGQLHAAHPWDTAVADNPKSPSAQIGGIGIQIDVGQLFKQVFKRPNKETMPDVEMGQLQVLICPDQNGLEVLQSIAQREQLSLIAYESLPSLQCSLGLLQASSTEQAIKLKAQLRLEHPEWIVDLNARQYPQTGRSYATQLLNLSTPTPVDARGIKIGVIDSPTNADNLLHVATITRFNALSRLDQAANPKHGNAIAQLIAATPTATGFAGLTTGANLYWATATRQMNGKLSTNTFLLSRSLDWLIGQHVHLINISLGGGRDEVLTEVFKRAVKQPTLLIAAAGNGGPSAEAVYPAAFSGVIAVTAIDVNKSIYNNANRGDYILLAAPGVDIWIPQDQNSGEYMTGTSFAAALVTGSLAQLGAQKLREPTPEIKAQLCLTAKDLGAPKKDPIFGCGLLQLAPILPKH